MNSKPLVSVVIPAYNAERFIEQAVRSALGQSYRNFEVIVVDDGSTDGTIRRLQPYLDRIRLLRQENSGVCTARNKGIAAARAEWIAFLDADDVWKPEKLEKQMEIAARFPEVDAISAHSHSIDEEGRLLERAPRRGRLRPIFERPIRIESHLVLEGNVVNTSMSLVKKRAVLAVGGFSKNGKLLSEDYDLWLRMAPQCAFYLMDEYLGYYRVLEHSSIHGSLEKEYGSRLNILNMHRGRFPARLYRRAVSRVYRDWADSAFYKRVPGGWKAWFCSIRLNPLDVTTWLLGLRVAAKRALFFGFGRS